MQIEQVVPASSKLNALLPTFLELVFEVPSLFPQCSIPCYVHTILSGTHASAFSVATPFPPCKHLSTRIDAATHAALLCVCVYVCAYSIRWCRS